MKGILFNLIEEIVTKSHGEAAWDQLLQMGDLKGAYTSLGNYPDEHLFKIVSAASQALTLPAPNIIRWVGKEAIPLLANKYPSFFTTHSNVRSFILSLNQIIHPEVRKLYPGADVPDFDFEPISPQELRMGYRSKRKLCWLAEGLMEGAAAHYKESIAIEQLECMHRGNEKCIFKISFHGHKPVS